MTKIIQINKVHILAASLRLPAMSRLSRANVKARESIFASGPEQYIGDTLARCPPDLEECVLAMEDCCEEAYEAQILLRTGTQDLPRMSKILGNEAVFLLVNEATVKRYKSDLADEIEPVIAELIERAQQGLSALEKKEHSLQSKVAQLKPRNTAGAGPAHKHEARRLQNLTKQRERLEADVRAAEEEILDLERKNR
jgi:DASH complex subunit SPC19